MVENGFYTQKLLSSRYLIILKNNNVNLYFMISTSIYKLNITTSLNRFKSLVYKNIYFLNASTGFNREAL